MTYRTELKQPNNIIYRKGDIVKELKTFISTNKTQGYDILVPQCFGLNTKSHSKLAQNLFEYFSGLSNNLDMFVANKKNYGHTQFIEFDNKNNKNFNKIIFANMVCIKNTKDKRKLDYILLCKCMSDISIYTKNRLANSEHDRICIMSSRFGTGFHGGNWSFIEQLIYDSWDKLTTTIYNYEYEKTY